jgi:hypothetical protein
MSLFIKTRLVKACSKIAVRTGFVTGLVRHCKIKQATIKNLLLNLINFLKIIKNLKVIKIIKNCFCNRAC